MENVLTRNSTNRDTERDTVSASLRLTLLRDELDRSEWLRAEWREERAREESDRASSTGSSSVFSSIALPHCKNALFPPEQPAGWLVKYGSFRLDVAEHKLGRYSRHPPANNIGVDILPDLAGIASLRGSIFTRLFV
jgi:hypothetical protein